ncbi:hypothetical protein FQZ97_901130 [compost metagenome]
MLVQVGRHALAAGGAQGRRSLVLVAQVGLLGHQVQEARGGATAGLGPGRALDDLDLLQVEGVARDGAQVADAVHEGGLLQREAAQLEGVTRRGVAVLTHLHGDAGGVAQRLHQAVGALLAEHFLLDYLNGFRRIEQRLGQFAVGAFFGLVGHLGFGGHDHLRQAQFAPRLFCLGKRHPGKSSCDQRCQVADFLMLATANGHANPQLKKGRFPGTANGDRQEKQGR